MTADCGCRPGRLCEDCRSRRQAIVRERLAELDKRYPIGRDDDPDWLPEDADR